eukprot:g10897.t1
MADPTSVPIDTKVLAQALDVNWISFCLVLVLLMQAGFASYEVGAIRETSTRYILLKNISDATVSLVAWYMLGYGIAFGDDAGRVIGTSQFFFAGAIADRIPFKAYIVYSFLTSALFYPLLAHGVWSKEGWAAAFEGGNPVLTCGVLDFAGSGVVHMAAGGIGIFIARKVKSRGARFFKAREWDSGSNIKNHTDRPQINEAGFRPNDPAWMTLGCFLLWLGWYGFNCGSTYGISTTEAQTTAGRAAMNTTIAAASGCIFSMLIELVYHLWSPEYRQQDPIDDPLHVIPLNVDAGSPEGLEERKRRAETILRKETLDKIKRHKDYEEKAGFTWPFSTHKNLHTAAVNGILAGKPRRGGGVFRESTVYMGLIVFYGYRPGVRPYAWAISKAGGRYVGILSVFNSYGGVYGMLILVVSWGSQQAFGCTWVLWGVLRALRLVELAERGEVHAKAADKDLADFEDRVADHFEEETRKDNRRLERIEELTRRLDGLENSSRTALNNNFEALTSRMDQLENALWSSTSPGPGLGATPSRETEPGPGMARNTPRVMPPPPSRTKSNSGRNRFKGLGAFFGLDKEKE